MSRANKTSNRINGLKLRTITICLIALLLALCSAFSTSIINIRKGYKTLSEVYEDCVKYRQKAQMVREGSYYLTEKVHLYVTTCDKKYADDYFKEVNVTKRRTDAVEDLRRTTVITSVQEFLIDALEQSERLKEREVYAIRLVAEAVAEENQMDVDAYLATFDPSVPECGLLPKDASLSFAEKIELANNIVFNDEYLDFRDRIDSNIQDFLDSTYQLTSDTKNNAIESMKKNLVLQCILIILMIVLTVTYLICIISLVLRPLNIFMRCIRERRAFEMLGAYEFKHLARTYNNIFEVQHENEKMLRQNAEHDPLTGLLNRGAYNRISAQYVDRDVNIASLIIDIDNFKNINDTYGHAVGDDVIRSVGELLLRSFRPSDIIARIGGDEFAVIMLDITGESAENIGVKIKGLNDALQNPASDLPKISLSVGAAFSEFGYSKELFKRADAALYKTKQNGKNGFSYNQDIIVRPDVASDISTYKKSKFRKGNK